MLLHSFSFVVEHIISFPELIKKKIVTIDSLFSLKKDDPAVIADLDENEKKKRSLERVRQIEARGLEKLGHPRMKKKLEDFLN
ncbi:MAG: hypothetical protein ABFR82_05510 [Nitrospirota bacterium]